MLEFESINKGYNQTFKPGQLSIGLVVPIENYDSSPVPSMRDHVAKIQQVEALGFKAIWIRDIPLHVPAFGDAGQTFDPFTYLGFLAGQTSSIALGVSSIALPLHHPLHVAKAAATIDQLSEGRLILGVASGDRPEEYPSMGIAFDERGTLFQETFEYIRAAQSSFPCLVSNNYGELSGTADILPKPYGHKLPLLITGSSRQSMEWNAEHGDGWMNYPRNLYQQKGTIESWRQQVRTYSAFDKPFMQPLYVMLEKQDDYKPVPIPLGFRIGIDHLIEFLYNLQDIGVNHLAINLRFNQMKMNETLEKIARDVLPQFHQETTLASHA